MLMTETMHSIHTTESILERATMLLQAHQDKKKQNKAVGFAKEVATVVAEVDLGDPQELWYSKDDLKLFREKAKALSDYLHQSQPVLAQEIEAAHKFVRANKDSDGKDSDKLLNTWHKLGSSRRGLERFVLSKETRRNQAQEVKASRSVVLNLQCLFQRSPAAAAQADQHAEMIRQQYFEFTKPAQSLAYIYAAKDAETVKAYHEGLDDEEEDLIEEDLALDDGILSVGSCSSISRGSISGKKVKKRSDNDSSSSSKNKEWSSKSSKSKTSRSLKRTSSKKSLKATRSKSPMRRAKSTLTDLDVIAVNSRPL